tara:strand:+ start:768 stop:1403 length:636 start_codon:yes stop_codon:yes gene_type:complete
MINENKTEKILKQYLLKNNNEVNNNILTFLPIRNKKKDKLINEFKKCLKRINYKEYNFTLIYKKTTYFQYGYLLKNNIKDKYINTPIYNIDIPNKNYEKLAIYKKNIDYINYILIDDKYSMNDDDLNIKIAYKNKKKELFTKNEIKKKELLEIFYEHIIKIYNDDTQKDYLKYIYFWIGSHREITNIEYINYEYDIYNNSILNIIIHCGWL